MFSEWFKIGSVDRDVLDTNWRDIEVTIYEGCIINTTYSKYWWQDEVFGDLARRVPKQSLYIFLMSITQFGPIFLIIYFLLNVPRYGTAGKLSGTDEEKMWL